MKRLILHLLIATLTFTFGLGTDRILNSKASKAPMPEPQKVETYTPQVTTMPTVPVIPVAVYPETLPRQTLIFDYNPKRFDPNGVYYILGRKPKEFRELESIDLWSGGIDDELSGGVDIETYSKSTYEGQPGIFVYVTDNRLFFVTLSPSDDGFSYRFDGEFLTTNLLAKAGKKEAVVRGTLTKTKHGRKVAESVVSLRMENHMGC